MSPLTFHDRQRQAHDNLVHDIYVELKERDGPWRVLSTHVVYSGRKGSLLEAIAETQYEAESPRDARNVEGEIDIVGIKNGEIYAYEVKNGKDMNRATRQLMRFERWCGRRIRKFFANHDTLYEIIRRNKQPEKEGYFRRPHLHHGR